VSSAPLPYFTGEIFVFGDRLWRPGIGGVVAADDWLVGAIRVESTAGGDLLGGPPRWVWHTYEADPKRLTAVVGARALRAAGHDAHFVFNPLSGQIAQLLPASRSARTLKNLAGGVQTNRLGSVCLQVEVIGFAANPFTSILTQDGRAGLGKLVAFARAHGIPDVWPAGPPPAYPSGSSPRRTDIWVTRAGHYGHSQVPENDHGDPGAIDTRVLFAAAAAPITSTGGRMDLYRGADGRVWDVGPVGRRFISHPDVVRAYQAKSGNKVVPISDAALSTIPRLPDSGLPPWVLAAQPPAAPASTPAVDIAALAVEIVRQLPPLPGGAGPTAEEIAVRTVDLLAARVSA
jgi:hypothetical protein